MGITENAAYLKGLAEGLGLNGSTNESKIILKLIDLVGDMAEKIDTLEKQNEELFSYIEEIDEDLGNLEEDLYSLDEDEDYSDLNEDDDYSPEDDGDYYEIECPSCGEKICFTEDVDIEDLVCPVCGELVGDAETLGCDGDCDSCDGCE